MPRGQLNASRSRLLVFEPCEPRADRVVPRPARRVKPSASEAALCVAVSTASSSTTALGVAATHRAPRIRARESGLSAAPVGGCGDSSSRGVPRGTLGRMTSDMDADLLGSGLDRRALLDVLRRTLEAAGMQLARRDAVECFDDVGRDDDGELVLFAHDGDRGRRRLVEIDGSCVG